MKVGIIGAGPSGLACLKHSLQEGFEAMVFEQNSEIGGQWYYTGAVGKNKFGIETHSSVYDDLLTNVPKQAMEYPGFPFPEEDKQFNSPDRVLNYLKTFADAFNLRQYIKLEHHVVRVRPLKNDAWEVIVRDLPKDNYETFTFDLIFVCNGMSVPWLPKLKGHENFKGHIMHSHDYRNTKMFENKCVLVIGSGTSAVDVVTAIGRVAKRVGWMNKFKEFYEIDLELVPSPNISFKPDIECITENGVKFVDGSSEDYDVIIYATGYDFSFPFLSVDCGLSVDSKHVYPLYKHMISINRPSMAIIGLPFIALSIPMFDLQVRFCLQYWTGRKQLPSKSEMLEDTENDMEKRKLKANYKKTRSHYLGPERHIQYYDDLSKTAEIKPLKPVLGKILSHGYFRIFHENYTFRSHTYKILNDDDFEYV